MFNKVKMFFKNNWSYLLTFGIILLLFLIKIPYQVEMPGGIIDLNNRVTVDGEETQIEGSFNMSYVSVVQGSIPYALLSYVIPDWDLVKSDDVKNENETIDEANKRDKLQLEQSKNYAIVAALCTRRNDGLPRHGQQPHGRCHRYRRCQGRRGHEGVIQL